MDCLLVAFQACYKLDPPANIWLNPISESNRQRGIVSRAEIPDTFPYCGIRLLVDVDRDCFRRLALYSVREFEPWELLITTMSSSLHRNEGISGQRLARDSVIPHPTNFAWCSFEYLLMVPMASPLRASATFSPGEIWRVCTQKSTEYTPSWIEIPTSIVFSSIIFAAAPTYSI
jgi:hypothetical protein